MSKYDWSRFNGYVSRLDTYSNSRVILSIATAIGGACRGIALTPPSSDQFFFFGYAVIAPVVSCNRLHPNHKNFLILLLSFIAPPSDTT